jgi:hypothetical protein
MLAYHQHPHQRHNPDECYRDTTAGQPRGSHSSATSSTDSFYSAVSSIPPRRQLSAVEDLAAFVRARWAALEVLERASGAPAPIVTLVDTITANNNDTTNNDDTATITTTSTINNDTTNNDDTATITTTSTINNFSTTQIDSHATLRWKQRRWVDMGDESKSEGENENEGGDEDEDGDEMSTSTSMQVNGHEAPILPRLLLTLHTNSDHGPASALASMPATPLIAMEMSPMMGDTREANSDFTPYEDHVGAGVRQAEFLLTNDAPPMIPRSQRHFRITESQRNVDQLRPTRALVQRRYSITDELEAAVRFYPNFRSLCSSLYMLAEGRGDADHAAYLAHGRTVALSTARVQRAPSRRPRAHLPPAHPRRWGWIICMRAMWRCVR